MRTIAVMNQKGGVGKTTTSVNLAAGLAQAGRRVCLIDLDPQAHASIHVGVDVTGGMQSIYQVFTGEKNFNEVTQLVLERLWLAPSDLDLAAAEVELVDVNQREFILKHALMEAKASQRFDYIIMDCPPSLGVLTVNALSAANEVFIPLQPHFFALQGLSKLFETTALVNRRLNRGLRVSGIVMCLYETGTRLANDVTDDILQFLSSSDPSAPWANAQVFENHIRRNIKLAEAPSHGQSIFDYAPGSAGAQDYSGLVREVVAAEQNSRSGNVAA
ncbi:MAG: ParA family protein [Planctomycetaceae bacterium]|nr:ParA family protein [Planctomycetaceae bacterium]